MANATDIKNYLMTGESSYFKQENRNGEILMLSGVWGSGKTHFWKNEIEDELIETLKEKDKSYVFISLYGKDSIGELQNEIFQLAYSFSQEESDIISSVYSVFTKVTSFMPKISFFGLEVELDKNAEKVSAENMKQQIEKGIEKLRDGGIICFDDFERKSSKIDLNDLFGFITNLTEVFQTKTVIIINQEFFKENDSEVFSRIKEKSVNKFLLLDPTVDELFDTIYTEKYTELDEYKDKIIEAIKVTEEKNARIFIQVLDNCLEYKNDSVLDRELFLLVLITITFVKYNFLLNMWKYKSDYAEQYLPNIISDMPKNIVDAMFRISYTYDPSITVKDDCIDKMKDVLSKNENTSDEKLKDDFAYIDRNKDILFQVYKYYIGTKYFKEDEIEVINRICDFVESGILPNE